jgi:hypothetical protein
MLSGEDYRNAGIRFVIAEPTVDGKYQAILQVKVGSVWADGLHVPHNEVCVFNPLEKSV